MHKNLFVSTLEFEKQRRMTVVDFLSNMGGLFGLCLGFSIISFVEVFYWLLIKPIKDLGKK